MNRSEKTGNIDRAILHFQSIVEAVDKDKRVEAGSRKYNYATYESLISTIQPALTEAGLIFGHSVSSSPMLREIDVVNPRFEPYEKNTEPFTIRLLCEYVNVSTRVTHAATGEFISCEADIAIVPQKGVPPIQVKGGIETYTKRYQLTALLGLITEDTDGNPADRNNITNKNAPVNKPVQQQPVQKPQSTLAEKAAAMAGKPAEKVAEKPAQPPVEKATEKTAGVEAHTADAEAALGNDIKQLFGELGLTVEALKQLQEELFAKGTIKATGKKMDYADKLAFRDALRQMLPDGE
jgi:hypothetical protein